MGSIEYLDVLKQCPFCSGKAYLKIYDDIFGRDGYYTTRVECQDCHCTTAIRATGNTVGYKGHPSRYISLEEAKNDVISLWNKRENEKAAGILYSHISMS